LCELSFVNSVAFPMNMWECWTCIISCEGGH
jgi:hypothetical protein